MNVNSLSEKLSSMCVAIFLAISSIYSAKADIYESTISIFSNDGTGVQVGTGFFIDRKGLFVTNYHVVERAKRIDIFKSNSEEYNDISVVSLHPEYDIALLRARGARSVPIDISSVSPPAGAVVTVVGHPNTITFQEIHARTTSYEPISSDRIKENGKKIFNHSIEVYPLDTTAYKGMSGAPVVDSSGSAIGIFSGSYADGGGIAWAISGKYIIEALKNSTSEIPLRHASWERFNLYRPDKARAYLPAEISAASTIEWLNKTWRTSGVREYTKMLPGGPMTIYQSESPNFSLEDGRLKFWLRFRCANLVQEDWVIASGHHCAGEYDLQVNVDLRDASRSARGKGLPGEWFEPGHSISIICPKERHCIRIKLQDNGRERTYSRLRLPNLRYRDIDASERTATAIKHLIRLHGGPRKKDDLFEWK